MRGEFEAVERLGSGDVLVAAVDGPPAAFWGELLTRRALCLGAAGAVMDGYTRDLARIRAENFPLWAAGTHPADSAGRLEACAVGKPITCCGVVVNTGDLVVAGCDGIAVIPRQLAGETLRRVVEKDRAEHLVRAALEKGASTHEVYREYGIL